MLQDFTSRHPWVTWLCTCVRFWPDGISEPRVFIPYCAGLTKPDRWSRGAKTLGTRVVRRRTVCFFCGPLLLVVSTLHERIFRGNRVPWSMLFYLSFLPRNLRMWPFIPEIFQEKVYRMPMIRDRKPSIVVYTEQG